MQRWLNTDNMNAICFSLTLLDNSEDTILWTHHHWQYSCRCGRDDTRRLSVSVEKNLPDLTFTHWLSCSIKAYTRECYRLLWPSQIPGKYGPWGAPYLQTEVSYTADITQAIAPIKLISTMCSTGWTKIATVRHTRNNKSSLLHTVSNAVTCINTVHTPSGLCYTRVL